MQDFRWIIEPLDPLNPTGTQPAHRAISVITLLQAGVVVFGTLWVTVMCKANGYGTWAPDADFIPEALFIRRFGWTLLLLPAGWAACALVGARLGLNIWLQRALIVLGLAAILFALNVYLNIGASPRTL